MVTSDKTMRGRPLPDCAHCPPRETAAVDVTARLRAAANPDRYEPEWNDLLHEAADMIEQLRAELGQAQSMHEFSAASARQFWQRTERAEAAIARVRKLCDKHNRVMLVADIRAALEGNQS